MIAALLALAHATAPPPSPTPARVAPAAVLARYAQALARLKEPRVVTFDYTLDQTGLRTLAQTHRVFRAGNDERDETLTVDSKRLSPPKVRIFRGRRNRYTVARLAPRLADYDFAFVGTVKDAHHQDYVFRLTPHAVRPFSVTTVRIDGVRFLPLAIDFVTSANEGTGSVTFGSDARWWVPFNASAHATVAASVADERLTFYTYRFPSTLPPSTFTQAHRLGLAPPPPTNEHLPAK